eukprot:9470170-Pyramimonas_sp.AAC.1
MRRWPMRKETNGDSEERRKDEQGQKTRETADSGIIVALLRLILMVLFLLIAPLLRLPQLPSSPGFDQRLCYVPQHGSYPPARLARLQRVATSYPLPLVPMMR